MSAGSEGLLPTNYDLQQSAAVIDSWDEQDPQLQQFGALADALVFVMEQIEPERHASVLIAF